MEGIKGMKHYNNQELDAKIHTFLSKKMQKYPELATPKQATYTVTAPSFSTKLFQALTSAKPLSTH
jgi:hypothetical protein